jgi:hypothetical protein
MSTDATGPEPLTPDGAIGSARDEYWSRFSNELKLADFAEAERITPARSHVGYWFFYIISRFDLAALLVVAIIMGSAFVPLAIDKGWSWQNATRTAAFLIVLISFFGGWTRRLWSRRFGSAQQRLTAYPYGAAHLVALSADGIRIDYGLLQQCQMRWDEFVGFHEGRRIILLIRKGSHEEVLISKNSMADDTCRQLRNVLTSNVGSW